MEIQYKDNPAVYIAHVIDAHASEHAQWCIGGTKPTRTALDVADEVLQQTRAHLAETAARLNEDTRIIGMTMEEGQELVLQEAGMCGGESAQWWEWTDDTTQWLPLLESQRKGVQVQLTPEGRPERLVMHCKKSDLPTVARSLVDAIRGTMKEGEQPCAGR